MSYRFEGLPLYSRQWNDLDAPELARFGDVWLAGENRDIKAELYESRIKFFTVVFDPTVNVGDTSRTNDRNAWSHLRQSLSCLSGVRIMACM